MGKKVQALLDNLLTMAEGNGGVALIEVWVCKKCEGKCFVVHAMVESMQCSHCGHSRATQLPRYQMACDAAADAERTFGEPAYSKSCPDNY